jgi:hypothetical protein
MAFEQPIILDSSRSADADLSAKQFHWVKDTATGIALCAAATDKPAGILQNQPKAGEPAQVMRLGISKAVCGGIVPVGAQVGTDAAGRSDAKVAGNDVTEYVGGSALEAGAANQIVTTAVNCLNVHRAA